MAAATHTWCDCTSHKGFHVDCDENGVLCFCRPHKEGAA